MPKLDLVVRGGLVVGPGWTAEADIGISDGKIAQVGHIPYNSAEKTVNARVR
jgi:predicted amidohydrolase